MRTFLEHVAKSDAVAESGLKVIAYFDALVEHRATLEACVRAAAALSQCVAGLRDDSSPVYVRFNRRGVLVDGPRAPSTSRPVRIGDRDVGEVWLEREEGPALLDELIVERMALAAGVLWRASPRPSRSIAGLIEVVLGAATAPDDRARAMQLLALSPERPLEVAAVASDDPDQLSAGLARVHQSLREEHREGPRALVTSAALGNVGAVLAQHGAGRGEDALDPRRLPALEPGFVVGVASARPATHAADAWQQAQTAMRFCGMLGLGNIVDYEDLGSLATLAELPAGVVSSNPDIRAIANLATTSRGQAVLDTLEQRLASGSIRETAAALYLHHSSVRYRLRQAEEALGLELENPRSRLRVALAHILWRLSSS
jgi:PucR C-terminal helix-turn-helix domain